MVSPHSARLLPLSTTGTVAAFNQTQSDTLKTERKRRDPLLDREDSLINRSSKPNADELINAIVKSRYQLMTFETEESKFMAKLKIKAI